MRFKKRLVVLAATIGLLAPIGLTSPAAAEIWANYDQKTSWARAQGQYTWFASSDTGEVIGNITDLAADGYCVYVRLKFTSGESRDSHWACPKGEVQFYTFTARGQLSLVELHRVQA